MAAAVNELSPLANADLAIALEHDRRLLFEKVAAWSLPLIYGVILLTGVMLDENLGLIWGRDAVRDLHLWSSELALPVTVWHLIRFLPISWQIARHDAGRWLRARRLPAQDDERPLTG